MPTNWKTPTADDLNKVISALVQEKANENTGADSVPGGALDPEAPDRRDALVDLVIDEFRGAIIAGSRIPLSLTPRSVPPECVVHVLSAAAYRLVNSVPNLQMVLLTDGGLYAPLAQMYTDAKRMLKELSDGRPVTFPDDPAEEASAMPDFGGAGSIEGEYDMRTYV